MTADTGLAPALVKNVMNRIKKYSTVLFQSKSRSTDEKRRTKKTPSAPSQKHAGNFSPGEAFSQNHGRPAERRRVRLPRCPPVAQKSSVSAEHTAFCQCSLLQKCGRPRAFPSPCSAASSPSRKPASPPVTHPALRARPQTFRRSAPRLFPKRASFSGACAAPFPERTGLPSPTAQKKQRLPASALPFQGRLRPQHFGSLRRLLFYLHIPDSLNIRLTTA